MARNPKAAPAKKAAQPAKKATAIRNKMSKAQILTHLATETGLTRKQVGGVMDELEVLIMRHIKKRSVGEFTLPGLMKICLGSSPGHKEAHGTQSRYRRTNRDRRQASHHASARKDAQTPEGNGAVRAPMGRRQEVRPTSSTLLG